MHEFSIRPKVEACLALRCFLSWLNLQIYLFIKHKKCVHFIRRVCVRECVWAFQVFLNPTIFRASSSNKDNTSSGASVINSAYKHSYANYSLYVSLLVQEASTVLRVSPGYCNLDDFLIVDPFFEPSVHPNIIGAIDCAHNLEAIFDTHRNTGRSESLFSSTGQVIFVSKFSKDGWNFTNTDLW